MITFIYILVALLISWVWIDYLRLISIFKKNEFTFIIIAFIIGGLSIPLALLFYNLVDYTGWELNNHKINDLLYSIFGIGLIEELSKLIVFLLFYIFFKRYFKEPIDYIVFGGAIALSFAAIENVTYFENYGPELISGRALLSAVTHLFDTSIIIYGIVVNKFRKNQLSNITNLFIYFSLGVVSHGIYDFWLLHRDFDSIGWFLTLIYYLFTISIYSTIINNVLNNMSGFSYKKSINPNKLASRLLIYYSSIYVIQFIILSITNNPEYALASMFFNVIFNLATLLILIIRLSRFTLIQSKWNPIKLELPFKFIKSNNLTGFSIQVKGDGFNETKLNSQLEEWIYIIPLSKYKSTLIKGRLAYLEKKIFINENGYFICNIFEDGRNSNCSSYYIRSKTNGQSFIDEEYPIVGLYQLKENISNSRSIQFIEWAYIKEIKK